MVASYFLRQALLDLDDSRENAYNLRPQTMYGLEFATPACRMTSSVGGTLVHDLLSVPTSDRAQQIQLMKGHFQMQDLTPHGQPYKMITIRYRLRFATEIANHRHQMHPQTKYAQQILVHYQFDARGR